MIEFLKNHKIEIVYVLVLAIVILFSNTVFASTEGEEETVIVVEIESEENTDDTSQTQDDKLSETSLPSSAGNEENEMTLSETSLLSTTENEETIQNENVESETNSKTNDTDNADMVVDSSEIMILLQTTNTCLIVLIFGMASVLGVLLTKCLFGWLI